MNRLNRHIDAVRCKYREAFEPKVLEGQPLVLLFLAVNFVEWGVRFLTGALLSAINRAAPYTENAATAGLLREASGRGSFGDGLGLLRAVATAFAVRHPELAGRFGCREVLDLVAALSRQPDVVEMRNSLIGHGIYDETGEEYRGAFDRLHRAGVFTGIEVAVRRAAEVLASGGPAEVSEEELFPFFVPGTEPDALGVLVAFELTADRPWVAHADFVSGRKVIAEREPFDDIARILIHAGEEEDPSYALDRALADLREQTADSFLRPDYVYERIRNFVLKEDDKRLYLSGSAGSGKSTLALFAEDYLQENSDGSALTVLLVPLRERMTQVRYFFKSRIAQAFGLNPSAEWSAFRVSLNEHLNDPNRRAVRLVVWLDGLDELDHGEPDFFLDLADDLEHPHIRWVFAGRKLGEIRNAFRDALKVQGCFETVELDPSADEYRQLLRRYAEKEAPEGQRDEINSRITEQPEMTFLDVKGLARLARLGIQVSELDREGAAWLPQMLESAGPELPRVLRLLAEADVPLTPHEMTELLFPEWSVDNWVVLGRVLRQYDFLFRRSGSFYRLSHARYQDAVLDQAGACRDLAQEVTGRLVERHFERLRMDLHYPSRLKELWLRGFGGLLEAFTQDQLKQYFLTVDPHQSFFWRRAERIATLPATEARAAYWAHLNEIKRLADRLTDRDDPLRCRVLDHLVALFNCGDRDVEWAADAAAVQLVRDFPPLLDYLFGLVDRFGAVYGVFEFYPGREHSSILSSVLGLFRQLRSNPEVWSPQGRDDQRLAQVTRALLLGERGPVKFHKRDYELFMASSSNPADKADVALQLLSQWRDKDNELCRAVVEGLTDPPTWAAVRCHPHFALLEEMSTTSLQFDRLLTRDYLEPIRLRDEARRALTRYGLQLAVRRLVDNGRLEPPHDHNYYLMNYCSRDWADRERLFRTAVQDEQAAEMVFRLLQADGKAAVPDESLLPYRDPTARRALYDLIRQYPDRAVKIPRLMTALHTRHTRLTKDLSRQPLMDVFEGREAEYLGETIEQLEPVPKGVG
jgi:hypothetical protein